MASSPTRTRSPSEAQRENWQARRAARAASASPYLVPLLEERQALAQSIIHDRGLGLTPTELADKYGGLTHYQPLEANKGQTGSHGGFIDEMRV